MEDLKREISDWNALKQEADNLKELISGSSEEQRQELDFLKESLREFKSKFEKIERLTLYQGEYDEDSAILSINSGAGGADAQDWAEMLLRMYLRYAERNRYKAKILNKTEGGEAGIKNANVEIKGKYAFGNLKNEKGVHRLVRLSPFNADNLRETSFASVEVIPIIDDKKKLEIKDKDLRIDTFRSSGAGGQHVNTTDSAVRITHLSSGITVSCQSERSQLQNKEQAMKLLRAKLFDRIRQEEENKNRELKGEQKPVEWGSQIRSYVLHPYKMAKDHRTGYETSNVEEVLDGGIEKFIEAELKIVR